MGPSAARVLLTGGGGEGGQPPPARCSECQQNLIEAACSVHAEDLHLLTFKAVDLPPFTSSALVVVGAREVGAAGQSVRSPAAA